MRIRSALLAYLLLTAAILRSGGSRDAVSLALVLASLAVALAGCGSQRRTAQGEDASSLMPVLLGGLVGIELVWLGLRPESAHLLRDTVHPQTLLAASVLGLLALTYAWRGFPFPHWRFLAVLAVYFVMGAWLVARVAPEPAIDVWDYQQEAGATLLRGENPYAREYSNIYGDTRFLGEKLLKDGKVQSFPYPPLSLLLVLPGYLVGDVRWALLLAIVGAAGFVVATGRRLGLRAGHPAELAVVSLLANPWGVFVVEAGWTEPLVALAASAGAWALAARRRVALVTAMAALLSLKQYGFLLLPALGASRRFGWRDLVVAVVGALVIALPFLLWGPRAFWQGLAVFHLHNPLREDSLSVLAAVAAATGLQLPGWIGLLAAAAAACWVWRQGPAPVSQAVLGGAAIVLAFFVFNRAAHLNYYWLAQWLLALGVVTAAAEAAGRRALGFDG